MSTFLSDGRPPTASSIDTDLASNIGGNGQYGGTSVVSSTGPVGEAGLPPSRQTDTARNSRRGFAAFGSARPRSARPDSSTNSTHIPLTSSQFFRPMSSQKLQAQRGQTVLPPPSAARNTSIVEEGTGERALKKSQTTSHRNSNASVHTMRDTSGWNREEEAPPLPVSRGGYSIATSAGGAPIGGSVDSTAGLEVDTRTLQQKEVDEKAAQKKRLGLGLGSRQSSGMDLRAENGIPKSTGLKNPPLSISPAAVGSRGRNYEYFAGNMLFLFLGRCLNTRSKPLNLLTLLLTILPLALFLGFSAPYIWLHISPAPVIIYTYISLLTLSSFLHAALSDPGILPRNLHPHPELESDSDPLAIGPPSTEWVMVKTFSSPDTHGKKTESETEEGRQQTTAMEVPTKYCKTCSIWRPPRTHHCRICDACMETQDHHCVWLNNCVGRRNYRYFFSFVALGSIMALLLIALSTLHITHYANAHNISFSTALTGRKQEQVAFAMLLYAILALPYPGSLWIYHLFLVSRGETTREYLNGHKFLPVDRHRPFSLGGSKFRNLIAVLARPRGPSYLEFKKHYQEGDARLGYGTRRRERDGEDRREAREQKGRVEGLKQRFSVAGGNEGAEKVEMKQLNGGSVRPPSTANGGGNGRPNVGTLDSTPRIGVEKRT